MFALLIGCIDRSRSTTKSIVGIVDTFSPKNHLVSAMWAIGFKLLANSKGSPLPSVKLGTVDCVPSLNNCALASIAFGLSSIKVSINDTLPMHTVCQTSAKNLKPVVCDCEVLPPLPPVFCFIATVRKFPQ